MHKSLVMISALLLVTTAIAFASDSATPAPKKPRLPTPSDWVKSESKAYHFSFSTPKQWTEQGSDGQFTFDLTPAKARDKGKNFGTVQVTASQSASATLEGKAADLRDSLPKGAPGSKLIKDEAATLGDHPAWLLVLETSTKTQVTNPSSVAGAPAVTRDVIKKSRTHVVIAVEGDTQYQVTFTADGAAYSSGVSTVNRVLDSFEIAAAPTPPPPVSPPYFSSGPDKSKAQPRSTDSVEVDNKTYHFRFFIPKAWQKNVQNDMQAMYMVPGASKDASQGIFLLVSTKSSAASLEAAAASLRKKLASKGLKIDDDRSTELGGKPAWLFCTEGTTGKSTQVMKMYHVISTVGQSLYDLSFSTEADAYDDELISVKPVIDSFAWTP